MYYWVEFNDTIEGDSDVGEKDDEMPNISYAPPAKGPKLATKGLKEITKNEAKIYYSNWRPNSNWRSMSCILG